jgi:hypothetical protein
MGSQQAQAMRMRMREVKAPPPPVSPPAPLGKLAALVMHALKGDADPNLQVQQQPSPEELAASLYHDDEVRPKLSSIPSPLTQKRASASGFGLCPPRLVTCGSSFILVDR